ncbi:MAG: family 16 glycosylhydrolase [Chitinophagaceae bacterium]
MRKISIIYLLVLSGLFSCGKDNNPGTVNQLPENLAVNAVVNPDNSGNVSFTATATNTVLYTYDMGDGVVNQLTTTGLLTYKYQSSGTYTVTVVAKSATGQTISKSITISVTVVLSLVWSDEFNTPGLPDANKWGYDLGAGGWGNNEVQYYTNRIDNAEVSGGTLKITLKKEAYSGSAYTSARLLSKGKYSFKYGKIEARAKLPAGGGTWPAIWMLGDNISTVSWPACGEIDIMEHVGNQLNKIYATLHHPGHSGGNGDGSTTMISNATTEFHKYSMEWSASTIKFYVDDVIFYTFANSASVPFNQNFFIILNVAMGGNFGGAVDPAFTSAAMEIDYVRVYN